MASLELDQAALAAVKSVYKDIENESSHSKKHLSNHGAANNDECAEFPNLNIELVRTGETIFVRISFSEGPGLFLHASKHTLSRELILEFLNHANHNEDATACCRQILGQFYESYDTPIVLNLCVDAEYYKNARFVEYCSTYIINQLKHV